MSKSYQGHSGNEHLSQEMVNRYLNEELSSEEMHRVERHLLFCEFCSDALEGLSALPTPHRVNADIEQLKTMIGRRVREEKQRTTVPLWQTWGVAAALVALLISTFVWVTTFEKGPEGTSPAESIALKPAPRNELAQEKAMENKSEETKSESPEAPVISAIPAEEESDESVPSPSQQSKAHQEQYLAQADVIENREIMMEPPVHIIPEMVIPPAEAPVFNNQDSATGLPEPTLAEAKKDNALLQEKASAKRSVADLSKASPAGNTSVIVQKPGRQTISGKVVASEDGSALPGVNITVKGSTIGTVTDASGRYSLTGVPEGSKLVFSYIGYESLERPVQLSQAVVDASMNPDLKALNEVAITGYGTREREEKVYMNRAKPLGGFPNFKKYIKDNLKYPSEARQKKVEGTVKISFTVEPDGKLSDMQVLKSLGYGCDLEAIRLIKEGPAWKAAQKNGAPVAEKVQVNIHFEL